MAIYSEDLPTATTNSIEGYFSEEQRSILRPLQRHQRCRTLETGIAKRKPGGYLSTESQETALGLGISSCSWVQMLAKVKRQTQTNRVKV